MFVKKISNNIYLIKFRTRYELTSTLLRFQEYYESPKFKGQIFTLKEFKKWYTKNSPKGKKTGKFTYYKDWSGFNIPSHILTPFYNGLFNPLTDAEKNVLKAFSKIKRKKFYIIGVYNDLDKIILKHEIAHGMYYANSAYRRAVNKILKKADRVAVRQIYSYFKKYAGYHKDVFADETHAYILSELSFLKKRGVDVKRITDVNKQLNVVFDKFSK